MRTSTSGRDDDDDIGHDPRRVIPQSHGRFGGVTLSSNLFIIDLFNPVNHERTFNGALSTSLMAHSLPPASLTAHSLPLKRRTLYGTSAVALRGACNLIR